MCLSSQLSFQAEGHIKHCENVEPESFSLLPLLRTECQTQTRSRETDTKTSLNRGGPSGGLCILSCRTSSPGRLEPFVHLPFDVLELHVGLQNLKASVQPAAAPSPPLGLETPRWLSLLCMFTQGIHPGQQDFRIPKEAFDNS